MRPSEPFRVRLAQVAPRLGDVEANMAMHEEVAARAIEDDIDLLVFPELSLTGYYLRDLTSEVALTIDDRALRGLAEISQSVSIVVGMIEESERFSYFASALYYERGKLLHVHRKVHPPTYGMFDEGRYVSAGRSVRAFDTRFGRMGLLICEDIWHPVLPFLLAQDGIHYLIVPANSPTRGAGVDGLGIERTYEALTSTYAQLFQSYIIFCNRVGYEDGVSFWGGSRVVSPSGECVASAPTLEAGHVDVELVPSEVRRARLSASLVEDENLDLALRELRRIADDRS